LTETTAKINVSSTPQQAVLEIGDEKKFDVTGDDFYDLVVKLNGIEDNKANVTITSIHEETDKNRTNNEEQVNNSLGGEANKSSQGGKTNNLKIIISTIVLVIVVVLITLGVLRKKRRKE